MAYLNSAATWHCQLSSAWSLLNGMLSSTQGQSHTWNIYISNFQRQSPLFTSCFTFLRLWACVKLKSDVSGSWSQAAGVRGECVTTLYLLTKNLSDYCGWWWFIHLSVCPSVVIGWIIELRRSMTASSQPPIYTVNIPYTVLYIKRKFLSIKSLKETPL